jgi:hypothetical protein
MVGDVPRCYDAEIDEPANEGSARPATRARIQYLRLSLSHRCRPEESWRCGTRGYPQDPENGYLKLGDKPANAPVTWANGDTPFRFQHWCSGKLTIGGDEDFKVFIGQPGRGENTFWAFQEHFLPESEGLKATLIYRDSAHKERRLMYLLKERC